MSEHAAITVRRDMLSIADLWPALEAAIASGSVPDANTGGKAPKRTAAPIPIDAHIADVTSEVGAWVTFLARVLMEEAAWRPRDTGTAPMLREIAETRVGHFTEHPDEMLRLAVADDAARLVKLVRRTINPQHTRFIPIGVHCIEHDTSDAGARIPCTGAYLAPLKPNGGKDVLGDFVCNRNAAHTLAPLEYMRGQRHRDVARDRDLDALINAPSHTSGGAA